MFSATRIGQDAFACESPRAEDSSPLEGVSLKHWSSTQTVIALSSGEAEFVALVKAVAEGMAAQALAVELGWSLGLVLHVESAAAEAIASRSGIGRVRHLEVKTLWVQAALPDGRLILKKVPGTENPANVLTKSLGLADFEEDLLRVGAYPVRRPK